MSFVLWRYSQAWRMWNSWLKAGERPEVDLETFIDSDFTLIDEGVERGTVRGRDNGYDVEINAERIHISFNGKPRFSWYPYVIGYGNLDMDDEERLFGEHHVCANPNSSS